MSPSVSSVPEKCCLGDLLHGFADAGINADIGVHSLWLDSRKVQPQGLFVALKGQQVDGLQFAEQAIGRGAAAILTDVRQDERLIFKVPVIQVKRLSEKIGLIASRFFSSPSDSLQVIGITGTNGKTSVSHFVAQMLEGMSKRCGVLGTLGNGFPGELKETGYTTADAVEVQRYLAILREKNAIAVAMEVSSHALDQHRVEGVEFDVAVLTNLSRDHLDYHGDMQSYANCKKRLFHWRDLKAAVVNADDPFGEALVEEVKGRVPVFAYSIHGQVVGAENLVASNISATAEGLVFQIDAMNCCIEVRSSMLGLFNVQNLLAVAGVGLALGFPLDLIARQIAHLKPVSGRMERVSEVSEKLVVVDYAHTPDALEKALLSLREHVAGRLICVFGCGGDRDQGKRPLMGGIAERYADQVIVTNDNPRSETPSEIVGQILSGLESPDDVLIVLAREEAIKIAIEAAGSQDCVLIAGKGHEDYQVIGDQRLAFSDQDVAIHYLRQERVCGG